jgi:GNAT superfamily N-acetyltransferase
LSTTIITPVRIRTIPVLHRLFVNAVKTNFAYFPDASQAKVIRDHRPLKLLLAAIHPRRIILTAHHNGALVGYAIGSVPPDKNGQLFWLYVEPARRGSNTGLALLSRMLKLQRLQGAHQVSLATHDHRRYYERQGFTWQESRHVDGVMMDIMVFRMEGR